LIESSASQKEGGTLVPEVVDNHYAESKLLLKDLGNPLSFSSWEAYLPYRVADFLDSRWDDKTKEEYQAAFNELLSQIHDLGSKQPLAARSAVIALCDLSAAYAGMERWTDAHFVFQTASRLLDDPIYKIAEDKHCLLSLARVAERMFNFINKQGLTDMSLFWHTEWLRLKERIAKVISEIDATQHAGFEEAVRDLAMTREANRAFHALVECQKRGLPAVLHNREGGRGARMVGPDADGKTRTAEFFLQRGNFSQALLFDDPPPTRESEISNIKAAEAAVQTAKKADVDASTSETSGVLIGALDNAAFHCLVGGKMADAEKWSRESLVLQPAGPSATAHLACALLFQSKEDEALKFASEHLLGSATSKSVADVILNDLTLLRMHGRRHSKELLLVKLIWERAGSEVLRLRQEGLKAIEVTHEKTPSEQSSIDLGTALSSVSDAEVFLKSWADAESHARKAIQVNPYREYAHGNLATTLLLQGKYDDALFIYKTHWLEPVDGWTLGDSILLYFERLEAIGITHPDIARVKTQMAELVEATKAPEMPMLIPAQKPPSNSQDGVAPNTANP